MIHLLQVPYQFTRNRKLDLAVFKYRLDYFLKICFKSSEYLARNVEMEFRYKDSGV